ncbi:hypothetical protein [Streptomyces uncialis]|uniref:Uncharacterized protein n=1 Tax=Streptomyces uncialis TaxID=1048205 RepID=A0A1Q4VC24_9ACTN|nr:hypothetical protein [Streptomyces uncialis]OKH95422.1 hypothetical protein AB852_00740 [Streptomyces uncialis]
MTSLPSNMELSRLHRQGVTDVQIAARYGVTRQAVNKRLKLLKLSSKPPLTAKANALVPWNVLAGQAGEPTHHTAYPLEGLKMLLRLRMGDDTLSQRQRADGERFERRLRKNPNLVLDYDRESVSGFFWRERTPEDGKLIVAWPAGVERPVEDIALLEMPS